MGEPRGRSRQGGERRWGGKVFAAAVAALVVAWAATTLSGPLANAWEGRQAKRAAAEYVDALDYTGSDKREYLSGVDRTVAPPFWDSPMGRQVEEAGDSLVENDGTQEYDFAMSGFELGEESPMGGVTAVAGVRGTEDLGDGEPVDVSYRMNLRLDEGGEGWRVAYADVEDVENARTSPAGNGAEEVRRPGEGDTGSVTDGPATRTSDGGQTGGPTVANREPTVVDDEAKRQREMEELASRYVEAAYSYVGGDATAYRSGVEELVIPESFWASPAGQSVEHLARDVESTGGAQGRAVLTGFGVEDETPATAKAVMTFEAGDRYGARSGPVEGGVTSWRQELTLFNEEGTWRVRDGETPEEASTTATPPEGQQRSAASLAVEEAIRGHYRAIGEGNFKEAYSYFGPTFRGTTGEAAWISDEESYGIRGSSVESVEAREIVGDEATAEVDVTFEDETGSPRFHLTWALVNEDGEWKLDKVVYGGKVD